jgi:chaperonin GroEL (HSP60 family)
LFFDPFHPTNVFFYEIFRQLVKQLFNYAKKEEYLIKSPAQDVEGYQVNDEREAPYFTKEELIKIAQTAMTGKGAEYLKEKFGEIIVEAIEIVAENGKVNLKNNKQDLRQFYFGLNLNLYIAI